ncbi:hypothetical protein [Sanguibacter sp. HDW7]|uniref:hypothetical protein n=1 Tax=Sanguibacter sp. HDW7 TaxID=2714931 RepID=UPI00140807BD|nr:hypothetical protein [Sanguibacter sp. HDW7]QIK82269.1 hypothetical protein G7063_00510 [Sanguibacter sp. HDW7]
MRALLLSVLAAGLVALPATAAQAAPASAAPGPDVVLVGTTGLQWEDVDPRTTPALHDLATRGALGSTVVRSLRSFTCPADGWLSVSSATRAVDADLAADPADAELLPFGSCRALTGPGADRRIPAWDVYTSVDARGSYGAVPGTVGDALAAAGRTTAALGPGAAIALAGTDGLLDGSYAPVDPADPAALTAATADALTHADVVVVDLGDVRGTTPAERTTSLARVEQAATAVRDALDSTSREAGTSTTLLVASVADGFTAPRLQIGAASGPGVGSPAAGSTLTSPSTRQPGYVITADWARTLLAVAGADAGVRTTGAVVAATGPGRPAAQAIAALRDESLRTVEVRSLTSPHYVGYALLVIAPIVLAGILVRRRPLAGSSPRTARLLHTAALVGASVPLAATLAPLVPWWRTQIPWLTLVGVVVVLASATAALASTRPIARAPLGGAGLVAGLTTLVLLADVVTGSRLQLNGVIGTQALVAGRFYGVNNTTFALLAATTPVVGVALAAPFVARGRRRLGALVVGLVGLVVLVVDGLPSLGADFGGPPALVPGIAVTMLIVAGVRLTWRRIVAVLGSGALVVSLFALADWLRPAAARTHLGAFVQQVLDGEGLDVVARKLSQNVGGLFTSPLALVGVLVGVALLWAGFRWHVFPTEPVREAVAVQPLLGAALAGASTSLVLGFAVNDSGILVPLVGLALLVPLVLVTWTRHLDEVALAGAAADDAATPEA